MKANKALSLFLAGALSVNFISCSPGNKLPAGLKDNLELSLNRKIQRMGIDIVRDIGYPTVESKDGTIYDYRLESSGVLDNNKIYTLYSAEKKHGTSTGKYYFSVVFDINERTLVSIKEGK